MADPLAPACAAFLACAAANGIDPAYVHRLEAEVQAGASTMKILYDGTVNDGTIEALKHCAPAERPLLCEFHQEQADAN